MSAVGNLPIPLNIQFPQKMIQIDYCFLGEISSNSDPRCITGCWKNPAIALFNVSLAVVYVRRIRISIEFCFNLQPKGRFFIIALNCFLADPGPSACIYNDSSGYRSILGFNSIFRKP